MVNIGKVPVLN